MKSGTLSLEEIQGFKGKYPRQLYVLFLTEMWERFTFYGMRALLILFMISGASFPAFGDEKANLTYGAYQALVYAMPVFGGMLADRLIGARKAIFWGGILMALGNFVLAVPDTIMGFYLGMGCIVVGNGFFKPNISSMVGQLYGPNDPRRDAGFSLFYMGINIGAFLGSLLCGWIGQTYNWHYGFGLAGLFMILGLMVFRSGQKTLGPIGSVPESVAQDSSAKRRRMDMAIMLGSLAVIPLFGLILYYYRIMGTLFVPFGLLALGYILYLAGKEPLEARMKIMAALVMIVFSILFWGFYEQGGGSLNLFAARNVNMNFFGLELASAAVNNAVNPVWVIFLSPVFGYLWIVLARKRKEPRTPVKFSLGLILLGLSFLVFVLGGMLAGDDGRISLGIFIMGYFVMSSGELCLSPIGLSMITKLSPARMVGLMMGMWFLASAFGQYVAGWVGTLMSIPAEEGEASGLFVNPVESLPVYMSVFETIAYVSIGSGVLLLILSPLLRRWMKEVH